MKKFEEKVEKSGIKEEEIAPFELIYFTSTLNSLLKAGF